MFSDAVRTSEPSASNYVIEECIKRWLRNAPDMAGGRTERNRKKKEKEANNAAAPLSDVTNYSDNQQPDNDDTV